MPPKLTPPVQTIQGVRVAGITTTNEITIAYPNSSPLGIISSINSNPAPFPSSSRTSLPLLALPPLTHPHVHLDKAYVHNTPAYTNLLPKTGTFTEALTSTTKAKSSFNHPDLFRRGSWLLAESVASGVTAMRAFVEVDATVEHICLNAGLTLKEEWEDICNIQLVCFAQDPLFSAPHGEENRNLIESALRSHTPDKLAVLGTTPYVESDLVASKRNIEYAVTLALETDRHLDFHLDYNLSPPDQGPEPLVWYALRILREKGWTSQYTDKRVMLGHCTRLSLFKEEDWTRLAREIREFDIPVSFVGLPTSDLYMASAPNVSAGCNPRGTLPVPDMIRKYGLDAVMGVNNVGNAFTPWGSADPLSLACLGVGIYQTGTVNDAELLYECVSTRARTAIGLSPALSRSGSSLCLKCGDPAELLLLYDVDDTGCFEDGASRPRTSVAEVVWDPPVRTSRAVVSRGRVKMPALPACFGGGVFHFVEA
ncbi:hypothetical protein BJX99DRAFT_120344 [Aspergillus californicus]